jgi:positive regulator of sigma E activity
MPDIKKGIVRFKEDKAFVEIVPEESCGGCKGCGACGGKGEDEPFLLPLESAAGCGEGQLVRVRILGPNQSLAAAVLFGLPLLMAFVLGWVGSMMFEGNALGLIVPGALGLAVGFMLVHLLQEGPLRVSAEIIEKLG